MKTLYYFAGGEHNGKMLTRAEVENISNGKLSRDWSKERAAGALVSRKELDNQPLVDGYLSPMWDGIRYEVNGKLKSQWECTPEEMNGEPIDVLRYETQDVYNELSH